MMTVSNKPLSASHPYIDSMQEHQRCLPLSESKQVCTGESRVFPQHHLTELHRSLQLRGLPAGIRAQCIGLGQLPWVPHQGGKWEHIKEKAHLQKLHPVMGH